MTFLCVWTGTDVVFKSALQSDRPIGAKDRTEESDFSSKKTDRYTLELYTLHIPYSGSGQKLMYAINIPCNFFFKYLSLLCVCIWRWENAYSHWKKVLNGS